MYPKEITGTRRGEWEYFSFNSLRAGRCIQSDFITCVACVATLQVSIPYEREGVSKADDAGLPDELRLIGVSIPYEREGVSKVGKFVNRFKFLKVSIPYEREGVSKGSSSSSDAGNGAPTVSIPYEREGVSKAPNIERYSD